MPVWLLVLTLQRKVHLFERVFTRVRLRDWTLSVVVRDGSKPYGFMPKNRACSLDFPRVRVTYRLLLRLLLRKVHLFGRVCMRVR